jgi:hypothetical protein
MNEESQIRRVLDRRGVDYTSVGNFTIWYDDYEKKIKVNKSVGRFTQHHLSMTKDEFEDLRKAINEVA